MAPRGLRDERFPCGFQASTTLAPMSVSGLRTIPIGPIAVPFGGSYLEFYKVIPKRNYFGAFGYT